MNKMTREEAIKAFKNCKFFAESPEKSAAAQRVLFSLGFKWKSGHTEPMNLDEACLMVEDGTLYWTNNLEDWSQEESTLVTVDDIINSYAPRRVRKVAGKFHNGQVLYSPKQDCIVVYRGTSNDGAILTDTFMYLSGNKLADFGGEVRVGNGYTKDYQPANDEQKARLDSAVTGILKQVRERIQKISSIDFDEEKKLNEE